MAKMKYKKKQMRQIEKAKRREMIASENVSVRKKNFKSSSSKCSSTMKKTTSTPVVDTPSTSSSTKASREGLRMRPAGVPQQPRAEREKDRDLVKAKSSKQISKEMSGRGETSSKGLNLDPSLEFLEDPLSAPVVARAKAFFLSPKNSLLKKFPISVGQTRGWRSVCKLSVRVTKTSCLGKAQSVVKKYTCALGLFLPQSTELLDLSRGRGSPVHHPLLDKVINKVAKGIEETKIRDTWSVLREKSSLNPKSKNPNPFERTRSDSLRNVVLGVERESNRVQITLIWNNDEDWENFTDPKTQEETHPVRRLVKAILASCGKKLVHSIFLHSNTLSKHDNSIVDFTGKWACLYRYGDTPVSIDVNPNPTSSRTRSEVVSGVREFLFQKNDSSMPRIPLRFPPHVFRQANGREFSKIVRKIRDWVAEFSKERKIRLLELYGGVGTIGLHLCALPNLTHLHSSDSNPYNLACFDHAVRGMAEENRDLGFTVVTKRDLESDEKTDLKSSEFSEEDIKTAESLLWSSKSKTLSSDSAAKTGLRRKILDDDSWAVLRKGLNSSEKGSTLSFNPLLVQYTSLSAEEMVRAGHLEGQDVCIVDPPRKGLDKEVIEALCKPIETLKGLVYVSCGFNAFCRDHQKLVEQGGWKLERAEGFLLFPGSDHIETLAFYRRE